MAASDSKDSTVTTAPKHDAPTRNEAFRANLAPESKPHTPGKSHELVKHDPKPADEFNEINQRQRYEDKLETEFKDKAKASAKGSPVDALGLPEGEGDIIWENGIEIGAKDSIVNEDGEPQKESDKAFEKRQEGAESALVQGARNFLDTLSGSLRPLGYTLTKTESTVRLTIVNTEVNPNPASVGGKPNELGLY